MDELIFENFTKKGHHIDDQRLALVLSAGAVQQAESEVQWDAALSEQANDA